MVLLQAIEMLPEHLLLRVLRQCMATLHCFMVSLPPHLHVTALRALCPAVDRCGKLALHAQAVDHSDCPLVLQAVSCMDGIHTVSLEHLCGSSLVPYLCSHLDKLPAMHALHVHALDVTAQSALATVLPTGAQHETTSCIFLQRKLLQSIGHQCSTHLCVCAGLRRWWVWRGYTNHNSRVVQG